MAAGGFELRGWEHTHDTAVNETTLVLGVLFNKVRDTISINPAVIDNQSVEKITIRTVLSAAHKIFDPIGFASPTILISKLILRKLHEQKVSWDQPLGKDIKKDFSRWMAELHYLKDIEIQRKFGTGEFSIHTFCDASEQAYAAVVFLRVENDRGVSVKILAAKARVAPRKATIPRLELLAATVGARLTNDVLKSLEYKDVPVTYWSDATTVLDWLNRNQEWGIFVWNRVREIKCLTSAGTWRHVPGEMNPADLPSRGCQAKRLFHSRWWEGADWLRATLDCWPNPIAEIDENKVNEELKKSAQISMLDVEEMRLR